MTITTKYAGPTNTRGSRIIVNGAGHRATIPYSYAASDAHRAALEVFCSRFGIAGVEFIEADAGKVRVFVALDKSRLIKF